MALLLSKYCVHKPINKPVIIADNNNHGKYIIIAKVFVINIAIIICPILCAQAPNILTIKMYFSSILIREMLQDFLFYHAMHDEKTGNPDCSRCRFQAWRCASP